MKPIETVCTALLLGILITLPAPAQAWGTDGHRIVGELAVESLDPTAKSELEAILGGSDSHTMEEACNWPDVVRPTDEWNWSSPQHYVNISRQASAYDRQRDCPDGQCVTEAIKQYAQRLDLREQPAEQRWQDLAWLCHLVGDLHQPLHTGFKDDRGGNQVKILYRGEKNDLHQFWDRVAIKSRLTPEGAWERVLEEDDWAGIPTAWRPRAVDEWTTESHQVMLEKAYPPRLEIRITLDEVFAEQVWETTRAQWQKAGYRLAMILNAVLGEGEVVLDY